MKSQTTTPPSGKRLNVKFLLIGLVGLCALGLGLAVLNRNMRLRRDRQTLEWAEKAMKDGQYERAAEQYARAVARHPDDPGLSLKSGDAFYALSASRPEALQKARVAWEEAARLDPVNQPALERLLRFQMDLAEVRPGPTAFRELGEIARKVVAISPDNKEAATARLVAQLGPWFAMNGPVNPSEDAEHDKLVASLGDAIRKDHSDGRAPLYYALASSRRAIELRQSSAFSSAPQLLNRAEHEIANTGNEDAQGLYRAAEGLTILAEANQRIDQLPASPPLLAPTSQPAATQPAVTAPKMTWPTWDLLDHQVKWEAGESPRVDSEPLARPTTRPANVAVTRCRDEARSLATRAAGLVAANDPHFIGIHLLEAHLAEASGDLQRAEQICREICSARPTSLRAQLELAKLVGESHPAQAMAILDQPEKADDAGPGPIVLTRRDLTARASEQKAQFYLDSAASTDDPAARQANLQKANAACDVLVAMLVNDASSLKLIGRLRMLQGRYLDAVRLLDRAIVTGHGSGDVDLLSYRATSLLAMHEPQPAIDSLRAALEIDPSRTSERLMLTQTLIDEGRTTEAAEQVGRLEKQLPADERVLALRVRYLVTRTAVNPDQVAAGQLHGAYSKLPEASVKQKLAKADLAISAGEPADAVRLLDAARGAEPSSVPLEAELVRAQLANGSAEQARGLLANALAQHPADAALIAVQKTFDGSPSPQAYESSLKDPNARDFLAAAHACRSALEAHDRGRAKEQIDVMARLRADEPLLLDLKFSYDLAAEQWSDAGLCTDKLAESNFDRAGGLTYRYKLHVARGQFIAAAAVARELTLRYQQFAIGWIDSAQAMQSMGQYHRAIDGFHHALGLEPKNLEAIKGLASTLESAGRMQEADQMIATGRQLAPADADLREMEFARQLAQGDPHRLIPTREAAMRNEPDRPDDMIALARIYLRISRLETLSQPNSSASPTNGVGELSFDGLAQKHDDRDKPRDTHDAVAKAVELLNGAVKKWPDDKACAFWAAHAAALAGDVAGGKLILHRLCDRVAWAARPDAEEQLADFCLIWGDPRTAEGAMRDAIARGASGGAMTRRLAAVLMRLGSMQAANDALLQYPTDPLAQQLRITIFVAAGQAYRLEHELRATADANPRDARIMTLLGMLYSATGHVPEARLWLDHAIAAGDEQLACRARGALILREKNPDLTAAIADLSIAHEANPSDGGAALLLSDACIRNQDRAYAAQVLETALTITPSDSGVRLGLIALERGAPSPDWDQVNALIQAGHSLAPSDWDWDAAEARMWLARHDGAKAAALMRHAVKLAQAAPEVSDPLLERQDARQLRTLIPNEFWMLLAAQANDAVLAEADQVISHYGPRDMLSAWAHYARAVVQRRTGRGDGGAAEYNYAIAAAQDAGGFMAASNIIEAVSAESGAEEAIRRLNAFVTAVDAMGQPGGASHDPRWDLLRIDLLRRNNQISAAAAEVDKLMPQLDQLPAASQIELLRIAVVVYLQDAPASQAEKARLACLALLKRMPEDPWALNNMAAICIERSGSGEKQRAVDYGRRAYRAAGRTGPVDPQIADTYGWALATAGRGSEAIDVLKPIAARLNGPDVQYHLAEAYLAAGDPLSAWPHLESAVQLIQRDRQQGHRVDPTLRSGVSGAIWQATRQTALQTLQIWSKSTPEE